MAERSALQFFVGWLGDLLVWMRDTLNDDQARRAIVADLGGDVSTLPPAPSFPDDGLESVKRYREASDPDLDGFLSALQDVRTMFDALLPIASAVGTSLGMAIHEALRAVIDLLATNYIRLRYPRTYAALQVLNFAEEFTSVYGDSRKAYGSFLSALGGLLDAALTPRATWAKFRLSEDNGRYIDVLLHLVSIFLVEEKLRRDDLTELEFVYGWDKAPGLANPFRDIDATLARMLTIRLRDTNAGRPEQPPASQTVGGILTIAPLAKAHGGPALFVALGADYAADVALSGPWALRFEISGAAGVALTLGGPSPLQVQVPSEASDFRVGIALEARPDPLSGQAHVLKLARGTEVQLGRLRLEGSIGASAATVKASVLSSALVLKPELLDGFLRKLLPPDGLRLPFDIAAGLATDRGGFIEGRVPLLGAVSGDTRAAPALRAVTASREPLPAPPPLPPLPNPAPDAPGLRVLVPIGHSLGPVTLHELRFELLREGPPDSGAHAAELSASLSAKIGPVVVRVERFGVQLKVTRPEDPAQANAGLLDLDPGIRLPDGVAVAVDAKGICSGGGFLFHDKVQALYAGALELTLKGRLTLKAFGLLATRLPDGSEGYSLLVFITAEDFRPYPLGMGFSLRGIGGMLGIHRRFDEVAMRNGLANGALAKLLFPKDPVRNAPEIVRAMGAIFPAREGVHLIGLLATISWPTPMLVLAQLALIYEIDRFGRLILLGRISSLLPSQTNDLVRLNLDALGIIDFNAGTVAIDAQLVDSRLAKKFVLTGGMALRLQTGGPGPGFAMAVGGFNPRFAAPANMPKLSRVTIDLAAGKNPRLTCEAYVALTPNTLQFGARAHLEASAAGFTVVGDVGFDVLIRLLPFHFLADFQAGVQLKRGTHNLFKVSVKGELEGPLPLRIAAKATFEILWCDFSVHFDTTLVGGTRPPLPPAIDAFLELARALGSPDAWTARLSDDRVHGVTLRRPAAGVLALDPLGDLVLRQNLVPLDSPPLDVFGGAPLADARSFHIDKVMLGNEEQSLTPVTDLFAPAQFFEMSDDDKIASPSFVEMNSGVLLGSTAVQFDTSRAVASPLVFETIVVDDEAGTATPPAPPDYTPQPGTLVLQASAGAVARGALQTSGAARFTDPALTPAVAVRAAQLVVASTADLSPRSAEPAAADWIASTLLVSQLNRQSREASWQLVPAHELAA
ncbi:DUF6603 domain-containing protein [Niveibacterium sp. SC-1]|uniref:DUF6603 domain-containing protein n=1 Tax=Niveibacterium sp. SC-1 TaxID=3135646 RepID=UPI003120139D